MSRPNPAEQKSSRLVWWVALVVALLLHWFLLLGVRAWSLERAEVPPSEQTPIELVFERPDELQSFTEQPEQEPDENPTPQALSNVTARARDQVVGGDDPIPQQTGEASSPSRELTKGQVARVDSDTELDSLDDREASEAERKTLPESTDAPKASLFETLLRQRAQSRASRVPVAPLGESDIHQPGENRPRSNADLMGVLSLSTYEWEHAPWLQEFHRVVAERWHAPAAYHGGLIHGWVHVYVQVSRSGALEVVEVLGSDVGHDSLTGAVTYALRAAAPYRALPNNFPDPSLGMQIRFVYPKLRRR